MIPTSVRPAQVMCTGTPLGEQPVEERDDSRTREEEHRGTPAASLALLAGGCCAAGRLDDWGAPGFDAAGFAAAGRGRGGAAFEAAGGAGRAGGAAGAAEAAEAGAAGVGAIEWGILRICVPPPFTTPSASSVGSNTSWTSPNRTIAPGASGASPFTRSPSTKLPFVDSRSTSTQTPSRRWSFAWLVDTDGSGITRSL